jgi:hypothetical protein
VSTAEIASRLAAPSCSIQEVTAANNNAVVYQKEVELHWEDIFHREEKAEAGGAEKNLSKVPGNRKRRCLNGSRFQSA